jgi:hypothetical protein
LLKIAPSENSKFFDGESVLQPVIKIKTFQEILADNLKLRGSHWFAEYFLPE